MVALVSPSKNVETVRLPARGSTFERISFVAADSVGARSAWSRLVDRYGDVPPEQAEAVVVLGGDGLMLQALHRHLNDRLPIYGMSLGSHGFLMNKFEEQGLRERLQQAEYNVIHPLRMVAIDSAGDTHEALAINEVSLFRQTYQAAKIRISVDGQVRLPELICDGVLVASPAGSTAYNLSVGGPILPLGAPLLSLTPISPFRPRRWRGAVLSNLARIKFEVLDAAKRMVSAVANHREFRGVQEVTIQEMPEVNISLMFDRGYALGDRVLAEQFVT